MIRFNLKELLLRYNVSSKELAAWMQVSENTVSGWANRKVNPSLDRIDAILNGLTALGDKERLKENPLSPNELLTWK